MTDAWYLGLVCFEYYIALTYYLGLADTAPGMCTIDDGMR